MMTYFVVLFVAMLPHVSSFCHVFNDKTKLENYVENVCDYDYGCHDEVKTRQVYVGPPTVECVNSSLDEMYSYYAAESIESRFLVYNSSLGSLKADGKLWPLVTNLTLRDAEISQISPGFFSGFSNLTFLSMPQNNISVLEEGIFSHLTHLEHLNLSYNAIERIEPLAFVGLSNLLILDLHRNKIVRVPPKLMLIVSKLTFLDISDNYLDQFRIGGIYLEQIALRNNNLSRLVISNDTSGPLLQTLDVSGNNISIIENFSNFTALEINLSFNRLKNLTRIGNIVRVYINHNQLDTLESNFISHKVEQCELSFNAIQNISPTSFSEGEQLKILNLSFNKIKQLSPSIFAKQLVLERLDLSNNNIVYFEFGTFENLIGLRYLNVSSNGALVDFQALFRTQQLETLDFEGDEPKNLDQFFFETHPKLKMIRMGYNTWNCEDLIKVIHLMELKKIIVLKGTHEEGVHIHGIECKSSSTLDINKEQQNIIVNRSESNQKQQFIILSTLLNMLNKTNQQQQTLNMLSKINNSINSNLEQQTIILNKTLNMLNKNEEQINTNLEQQTIILNKTFNMLNSSFKQEQMINKNEKHINSNPEQQTIILNKTLNMLNKNEEQIIANLEKQTIILNKTFNMLNNSFKQEPMLNKNEEQINSYLQQFNNMLNKFNTNVDKADMLNKTAFTNSTSGALLSRPDLKEPTNKDGASSSTFGNLNLVLMNAILLLILVTIVWFIRKRSFGRSNEQMEMVE